MTDIQNLCMFQLAHDIDQPPADSRAGRRFPDFIIAGAMKCATTSLHDILASHPEVFIPREELRFFAIDDVDQLPDFFYRGADRWCWRDFDADFQALSDWYASSFKPAGDHRLLGEDSPVYLASKKAAGRIARHLPNVKLIFLLRNPVDRAYSHYWHNVRTGRAFLSFEDTIRHTPGLILQRGHYHEQLCRYFSLFPREQIKVILFEEFVRRPTEVTADVCAFLGLDPTPVTQASNTHHNPGLFPRFPRLQLWRNLALRDLGGSRYVGLLPDMPSARRISYWKRLLARLISKVNPLRTGRPPAMRPETRLFLSKYYERENRGLDDLIQADTRQYWGK